jgi:hypothetical protein
VPEPVVVLDAQGLKVPVLETVEDPVVVLLGVCVREGRIVTEAEAVADTVFEAVVVAVAVPELRTVLETGADRDCEPLPVGVRDGLALADKVPEELPVRETLAEPVIVGLPVEVFEELVEPVIVLEPIILRLYTLLDVPVFVCRLDTDRTALELLVFEGAADGVTSGV